MVDAVFLLFLIPGVAARRIRNHHVRDSEIPHGLVARTLVGRSLEVHERVAAAHTPDKAAEACRERLEELRRLVAENDLKAMLDLSAALSSSKKKSLPEDCGVDRHHSGFAEVATKISTPHDREGAASERATMIRLHGAMDAFVPLVETGRRKLKGSARFVAVAGVELDGFFFLADSPLRCETHNNTVSSSLVCKGADLDANGGVFESMANVLAYVDAVLRSNHRIIPNNNNNNNENKNKNGRRRLEEEDALQLFEEKMTPIWVGTPDDDPTQSTTQSGDKDTDYVKGTKKILVIPVCASDHSTGCAGRFNYNKIQSDHGGNVKGYLAQMISVANAFFDENSFGDFQLQATITDPYSLGYTQSGCGSIEALDYWTGSSTSALDAMAFAAAENDNYKLSDFDFTAVVMDYCSGIGWSGIGWVGYPGCALNLRAFNYDASFAHELGHNFGANHASYMTGGRRGAYVYADASNTWSEYGSPHSTMGQGDIEDGPGHAHFMVANKVVFDWIPDNVIKTLTPYDFNGLSFCHPCGPFELLLVDSKELPTAATGVYSTIEIEAQAHNTFVYLEYRGVTTDGPAVIASWTEVSTSYGGTGSNENTVLVDATPQTASFVDAGIVPGTDFTVYLGSAGADAYPVIIKVETTTKTKKVKVTVTSTNTQAPTITPGPSTRRPTPAPTTDADVCGTACCDYVKGLPGWSSYTFERIYGPGSGCCNDHCSYRSGDWYLHYQWGSYFITASSPCHETGTLWFYRKYAVADVQAVCMSDSAAPTTKPTSSPVASYSCASIVDGSVSDEKDQCSNAFYKDASDPNVIVVDKTQQVAGIRCCDDSGFVDSYCEEEGGCQLATFDFAQAKCAAKGKRLCTEEEILSDAGAGTGCNNNFIHTWSSNEQFCAPASPYSCASIVDGSVSDERDQCSNALYKDASDPNVIVVDKNYEVAGIRCCDDSGFVDSYCEEEGGCQLATFDFAQAKCEAKGKRLCTEEEILSDAGAGTGCNNNFIHTWSSNEQFCAPANPYSCASIVDGSVSDERDQCSDAFYKDASDPNVIVVDKTQQVAGIRCCDDSGFVDSYCEEEGGCQLATFDFAQAKCEAKGKRLCTEEEILSDAGTGTGCYNNYIHTWSSNEQFCQPGGCVAVVDGSVSSERSDKCPNAVFDDAYDADVLYVDPTLELAGIRCCDDSGYVDSFCEEEGACQLSTFEFARAKCEAKGKRLCAYNNLHVWSSTPGACPTCGVLVDGAVTSGGPGVCPNAPFDDDADPDVLYADTNLEIAGVRCCDDNGFFFSYCDGDCDLETFASAKAKCEANGKRLCAESELLTDGARGTGCQFDSVHVWASGSCPYNATCRAVVDGDKSKNDATCSSSVFSDVSDPDVLYAAEGDHVAGIRCCDNAGGANSFCPGGPCGLFDFQTAKGECESNGMRLCTKVELEKGVASGTGCNYDKMHVWSLDLGACSNV
ncbi:hypothetical protein CTAYLR_000112 [Chrysophaeum taylorii]|uniref:Peptidase M11 gametolysin domain-containing protein n=1 Tax=Chrysophaeum taylorii TaxID=2483200 RepID=A0AAD7UGP7_9STRA|nr:hypothetical protein CTAYLR_000112 [Chrysophaeum taylorii]